MRDPEEKKIREDVESLIDGNRVVNFSDSVFAFAATLLVLKIDLPVIDPNLVATRFSTELLSLWPEYVANLISFLIIAYYWRQHHALFILIKRYDTKLVWLNILLLISVAFLPFPVDLFGDYPNVPAVTVFYSLSIALVGFWLLVMWLYALHNDMLGRQLSKRTIQYHTWTIAAAPLVFVASIPIIYFDHISAKISWLFLFIVLIAIHKIFKGHGKRSETGLGPV
jgi:uncharacterized membrane protein